MFFTGESNLKLPADRFNVVYKIFGPKQEAYAKALDICLEQTVEFPGELVPEGIIKDNIVGRVEVFEEIEKNIFQAEISYPVDAAAGEFTQLLNVIFGNISILPDIRVEKLKLSPKITELFKGPRFGIEGIRKLLDAKKRPLLFTALKPMGLTSKELATLAYKFALGGIDIIKDDHGLSNQSFSPFEERVRLCAAAVRQANEKTGGKSIYVPNITAPANKVLERAKIAKQLGAGGLLIAPGLTGLDVMREIAEDDSIALPIISHPAFQGSYVIGRGGISHSVLFGEINRLAGVDVTIYPNFGGRFSFSREECKGIAISSKEEFGHLKPIFPCPAGGMTLESIPESIKVYGNDVIFLIGGGLFRRGPDIVENCKYFKSLVEG